MNDIKDYLIIFIGVVGGLNVLLDAIIKVLSIKKSFDDKDNKDKR